MRIGQISPQTNSHRYRQTSPKIANLRQTSIPNTGNRKRKEQRFRYARKYSGNSSGIVTDICNIRVRNYVLIGRDQQNTHARLTQMTDVYRNLNRRDAVWYSIRNGGKVTGYSESVVLSDVRFKHATPAALSRIQNGPREVCQWVKGIVVEVAPAGDWEQVCGNPKTANGFVLCSTGERIDSARFCRMDATDCYVLR